MLDQTKNKTARPQHKHSTIGYEWNIFALNQRNKKLCGLANACE